MQRWTPSASIRYYIVISAVCMIFSIRACYYATLRQVTRTTICEIGSRHTGLSGRLVHSHVRHAQRGDFCFPFSPNSVAERELESGFKDSRQSRSNSDFARGRNDVASTATKTLHSRNAQALNPRGHFCDPPDTYQVKPPNSINLQQPPPANQSNQVRSQSALPNIKRDIPSYKLPRQPTRSITQASKTKKSSSPGFPGDEHAKFGRPKPSQIAKREDWQIQKEALASKFGSTGWAPRKRLSPDALEGIRALHTQYPEKYTTSVLADKFEVSAEAIRRILKSKWRPHDEDVISRRQRWDRRGERIWSKMVALGVKPPKKWREMGVGRDEKYASR